ncbi:MAG: DUF2007 domain-containing protein [Pseudohongiellaceae bacterium]
MKLVYTHENRFLVNNARNLVEEAGIDVLLKNEFYIHGIRPYDDWLELWVVNDADYEQAKDIVQSSFRQDSGVAWKCPGCGEPNDPSFDVCWQCQHEKPLLQPD